MEGVGEEIDAGEGGDEVETGDDGEVNTGEVHEGEGEVEAEVVSGGISSVGEALGTDEGKCDLPGGVGRETEESDEG